MRNTAILSNFQTLFHHTARFRNRTTLLAGVVLCFVPAAVASPVTFDLRNVTFTGGIMATGSFAFDSTTDTVSNINVIVSGPATGLYNFFASGPVAFDTNESFANTPSANTPSNFGIVLQPENANAADLILITAAPLSSISPSPQPLLFGTGFVSSIAINAVAGFPGFPNNDNESLNPGASLVPESSAAPEPASGVFASVVLTAVIGLRRRLPH